MEIVLPKKYETKHTSQIFNENKIAHDMNMHYIDIYLCRKNWLH